MDAFNILGEAAENSNPFSPMASKMFHLGDNDADPVEADIAEIRARVLGRRTNKTTDEAITPAEREEIDKELREKHQIDLNVEGCVAILEDPVLLSHMEAARRRLAEYEARLKKIPHLEASRSTFLNVMGRLSNSIKAAELRGMADKENIEVGFFQIKTFEALKPKTESSQAFVGQMKLAMSNYETLATAMKNTEDFIFVLRRDIETLCDTLILHVDTLTEYNQRFREAFAKNYKDANFDPPADLE